MWLLLTLLACPKPADSVQGAASAPSGEAAPLADKRPTDLTIHGETRTDEWYWLRDDERSDPEILEVLETENAWTAAQTAHLDPVRQQLYDEMVATLPVEDRYGHRRIGDREYWEWLPEGHDQPLLRTKHLQAASAVPETLLDAGPLAEGLDYFSLDEWAPSPDAHKLAYAVDTDGSYLHTVTITNELSDVTEVLEGHYEGLAWSADSSALFYTAVDEQYRPWQLKKHVLGTDPATDIVMVQEDDDRFELYAHTSSSGRYLVITLDSSVTAERRTLDLHDNDATVEVVWPREQGVQYQITHVPGATVAEDRLWVITNQDAPNYKLGNVPDADRGAWSQVLGEDAEVSLSGIDAVNGQIVLYERSGGNEQIRILDTAQGTERRLGFPDAAYDLQPLHQHYAGHSVRYGYSSWLDGGSIVDAPLGKGEAATIASSPLRGFDRSDYVLERVQAKATDGVAIPITVARGTDAALDGTAPIFLTGYAAYGSTWGLEFDEGYLPLLERGVVVARCHGRGGGELGPTWHDGGSMMTKKTSFTDFVACAEALVEQKYGSSDRLVFHGLSAGGLLMGAVANLRPDLPVAIVAEVPFVDVVTTMMDETIPLTVIEWEEWGNPNESAAYVYMRDYSPYDNVAAVDYPHMLIRGGLNDTSVGYWEPTKWAQRLRDRRTDDGQTLLRVDLAGGHGGSSGRYGYAKDQAWTMAWVLERMDALE